MCNELCRDVRVTEVVTARFDTSTHSLNYINLNLHFDAAAEVLEKYFLGCFTTLLVELKD